MPEHQGILLYDHAGHHFTFELANQLRRAGRQVLYTYTDGVPSPHGRVSDTDGVEVVRLGVGRPFERYQLAKRTLSELRLGLEACSLVRRRGVAQVITCNMPVIIVALLGTYCRLTGRRLTLWFQDSQAGIAKAIVTSKIALAAVELVERLGLRLANRVVAISPAMEREAARLGAKPSSIRVLPNWAPVDRFPVLPRVNPWSEEQQLNERFVFLYSGTLGLKHSPARLLALAKWIKQEASNAVVLILSVGPTADELRAAAQQQELPMLVLPYQDADTFPLVLATADVALVLLEPESGEFSVPSKVWSYMCAARPILGAVPLTNEAARVVNEEARCGLVVDPATPLSSFIEQAAVLMGDETLRNELARAGRSFAERQFEPSRTTAAFCTAAAIS